MKREVAAVLKRIVEAVECRVDRLYEKPEVGACVKSRIAVRGQNREQHRVSGGSGGNDFRWSRHARSFAGKQTSFPSKEAGGPINSLLLREESVSLSPLLFVR